MSDKFKNLNTKEPVRLRAKKLTKGGYSLYLDTYWNGQRTYEFLKLYLNKGTDEIALLENKTTIEIARQIKYKRILSLQLVRFGASNLLPRPSFRDYFTELANQRDEFRSNADNWAGALKHLNIFLGDTNPMLNEIDDRWLMEFKTYLTEEVKGKGKRRLKANTAHSYFNKIRSALTHAFDRNLLEKNPANLVSGIRAEGTKREFLTLEEVKKLADTPCEELFLKEAFLFSVLTGLRWTDIFNLTWEEVKGNEIDGWYIQFLQKKTKEYLVLPITSQAKELLGTPKEGFEKVFKFMKYSSQTGVTLSRWILKAGISKNITFHSARHTNATLLLSKGVDIYTVSKLLGHKNLKSTEQYAHMTTTLKIEAVNKMPLLNIKENGCEEIILNPP